MSNITVTLLPPQNWQDFEKLLKGIVDVIGNKLGGIIMEGLDRINLVLTVMVMITISFLQAFNAKKRILQIPMENCLLVNCYQKKCSKMKPLLLKTFLPPNLRD
ncbi:hypothetical protein BH10BAC2_BH10BAC2_02370 [soil metagenome]